ncbi:MAG TPA: hypothetical protein VMV92_09225 [Streptosporangiaceae bacterium]|nr:hypothetical protein [Streptosporangiaceae bacterium]
MTITRLQGTLTLAGGPDVVYRCGWLFWPAGRLSRAGRPLYALHQARDPAGAASFYPASVPCYGGSLPAVSRRGSRRSWRIARTGEENAHADGRE